jgi:hypothetical protein
MGPRLRNIHVSERKPSDALSVLISLKDRSQSTGHLAKTTKWDKCTCGDLEKAEINNDVLLKGDCKGTEKFFPSLNANWKL